MKKFFEQPTVALEILMTEENIMTEEPISGVWAFEEYEL